MAPKRVLVGYGIDVDAVSNHINTTVGGKPNLTNISRGVFGATRGVERLLALFSKKNIKCSWYVPGHTLETFPKDMAKIRDAGHEIGLHGYTHEFPSDLTHDQLEATLVKTIDILTEFCGTKPKGFTAPAWKNSPDQIALLEKHGILYDHSFMHDDFQPYYAPHADDVVVLTDYKNDPSTWMVPMQHSKISTSVVEIPANWTLDDWPPFQWDGGRPNAHGYVDPYSVERQWKDMFSWCYENYDTFVFPMSIHPQVSGRPHILMMHERLIDWINGHEGVEWCTFADMAEEFREGRLERVEVAS
ncbi:hypothetical protein PMZ80_005058 [Knufia obscura]|uniref:NodB homology domain-containing protein n=2 Tax=Knufia TaxID=430999 RepID=A0AAN8EWK0_9EURO|nr:hypothetical protein PMZ80_005058 [Knufia obscura]KAK5957720.1 hypothetical protein OHC33_000909 [Knufia fluminis]